MTMTTADLCDEFGEEVQVLEPLFRDYGGASRFWGPIATVDVFDDNVLVREMLERPGEGYVLVVDGGASLETALLGEELAGLARDNGWAGILIYGCVRDVAGLAEVPIGIRALASTPRRSYKRGRGACDLSLHFAGVGFRPGAYLYADEDGILVAPRDLLDGAE
jgi:regulator of ribonuclease activity A